MTGRRSKKPVLDAHQLLARVDDDRELLRELLELFKGEYPGLLTTLKAAASREDMKQVAFTAHTLKGMFASLAAVQAAAAAGHIEQVGNESSKSELKAGLEALEVELEELLFEVNSILEDSAG